MVTAQIENILLAHKYALKCKIFLLVAFLEVFLRRVLIYEKLDVRA